MYSTNFDNNKNHYYRAVRAACNADTV